MQTLGIVGILSFLFQKPRYMPSTAEHPYDQSSGKSPAHMHISMAIWAWNQIPATPWHYHDSDEVKTLCTVKPGFALTIHSPRGTGFLMTYLDLLVLGLKLLYQLAQLQTNESRIPVRSFAGMGRITTMDYRNGPKSLPLGTFFVF